MTHEASKNVDVPDRSGASALAWVAVIVASIFCSYTVFANLQQPHTQQDFAHYYASSRIYLESPQKLYTADLRDVYKELGWPEQREPIFRATNPPALVELFAPLAMLPPRTAWIIWNVIQLIALAVAIGLTWLLIRDHAHAGRYPFALAMFLMLPAIPAHFRYSQVQLLVFALILFAFWLHRRGFLWASILPLVFATQIKVFPVVLIPWFVWRAGTKRPTQIAYAAGTTAAMVTGLWLTDLSLWREFFQHGVPDIQQWLKMSTSQTFGSLLYTVARTVEQRPPGSWPVMAGQGLGAALLVAFFIWMIKRVRDANTEFAILVTMMLFCGSVCWTHYLVILLFPITIMLIRIRQPAQATLALTAIWLMLQVKDLSLDTLWDNVVVFLPLLSMNVMVAVLIFLLRRDASSPTANPN